MHFSNALKVFLTAKSNFKASKLSSRANSFAIGYSENGDPSKVLKKMKTKLPSTLGPKEVRVKMLAAPVNPADINMIQGTYGTKANLPAVGGNEGVGEVIEIGSEVRKLSPGSWVLPSTQGVFGTWTTHYHGPENHFIEIQIGLPIESAATILVNPCTAYRMLKDFVSLGKGETVIQNGANSGVGQAAIQVAKMMGLKTINVVRNREDFQETRDFLSDLGADFVVTEEQLRTIVMDEIFETVPKPKLGLNCVGGKSTTDMLRHLTSQGVLVTYGGMSRQPVIIPTASLIFKDICVQGFWLTRWNNANTFAPERLQMIEELCSAIKGGQLKPPKCQLLPLENYAQAIESAMTPFVGKKFILVMDPKYLPS